MHRLRDLGNTLLVVEHDHDVIGASDYLCDFGPAAGTKGGTIVARGAPTDPQPIGDSVTAGFINGGQSIEVPAERRRVVDDEGKPVTERLTIRGARENNLRGIDVAFPLGVLTVVSGPSGSGKSTLVNGILYPVLARRLHRARLRPGRHDKIEGLRHVAKVIRVDQSPLGNTPSSNPATYTGVFDAIRTLFAAEPLAGERKYTSRTFSFNVAGGRCDQCEGSGQRKIEMHFLPDVYVECETCEGHRYRNDVLDVKFRGCSVADVLAMPCGQAVELFAGHNRITRVLQTLCDVGLDYITLGQPAPTLSGGEAQRVKLAAELARPASGHTVYLLDEPTTGLHFGDIEKLLLVTQRLVEIGNTVIVIEHNLDVIKTADWVIDIGPGAGIDGGQVVFEGTPEGLAETTGQKNASVTAKYLKAALAGATVAKPKPRTKITEASAAEKPAVDTVLAAGAVSAADAVLEPWRALGRRWHTLPKGFDNGGPRWPIALADRTLELLERVAGIDSLRYGAIDRVCVGTNDGDPPWAEVVTKDRDAVIVQLRGNREAIDLPQLLAFQDAQNGEDVGSVSVNDHGVTVTLRLNRMEQAAERLETFLETHFRRRSELA